ncbi:hypothetical protein OUZ56_018570 [Daphnia magna]|uniref:Uncharacterized protein n=1 Tax=Daphnia magna TaxID=35525 RepID=A0ABQ9Z971_9CRUS|nr:hypothetical protein OUZ56_018570 [Daphnia magna]
MGVEIAREENQRTSPCQPTPLMFNSMIKQNEFCPDIEKQQDNLLPELDLESDTILGNKDNRPLTEDGTDTLQSPKTDIDLLQASDDTIAKMTSKRRHNRKRPIGNNRYVSPAPPQPDLPL